MKKLVVVLLGILLMWQTVVPQFTLAAPPFRGRRASAPATCTADRGEWYYNTTSDKFQYCSATNTWTDLGGGSGGITVGSTTSNGTANALLKTNGSSQVVSSAVSSTSAGLTTIAATGSFPAGLAISDDGTTYLTVVSLEPGVRFSSNGPLQLNDGFENLLSLNSTTNTGAFFAGGAVASAAAIAPTGNVFHVTGTTTVTSITSTNVASGTCITIIFDGALTFTDGSNLRLAGNFVTTADDTISLCYDGTNWFETARAVN